VSDKSQRSQFQDGPSFAEFLQRSGSLGALLSGGPRSLTPGAPIHPLDIMRILLERRSRQQNPFQESDSEDDDDYDPDDEPRGGANPFLPFLMAHLARGPPGPPPTNFATNGADSTAGTADNALVIGDSDEEEGGGGGGGVICLDSSDEEGGGAAPPPPPPATTTTTTTTSRSPTSTTTTTTTTTSRAGGRSRRR
jgi:hypothetical protein